MNQRKLQTGFSTAYTKKFKMDSENTKFDAQPSVAVEQSAQEPVPSVDGKKRKKKKISKKKSNKDKSKDKGPEPNCKPASRMETVDPSAVQQVSAAEREDWSAVQQQCLEQALRTTPKGPERWDQIASKVPGKTKRDCVKRFKDIRAKIMAQRASKA